MACVNKDPEHGQIIVNFGKINFIVFKMGNTATKYFSFLRSQTYIENTLVLAITPSATDKCRCVSLYMRCTKLIPFYPSKYSRGIITLLK